MLGIALVPAGETCRTTQTASGVSSGKPLTKPTSASTPPADAPTTITPSATEARACGVAGPVAAQRTLQRVLERGARGQVDLTLEPDVPAVGRQRHFAVNRSFVEPCAAVPHGLTVDLP